jgi:hypothetical protein
MKKYIVILTFVFVCALPAQDNSLISEIQRNKCVLHAVNGGPFLQDSFLT